MKQDDINLLIDLLQQLDDAVEQTLLFCSACLKDLKPGGRWLECCACSELRCYECEHGCRCDRMKKQTKGKA